MCSSQKGKLVGHYRSYEQIKELLDFCSFSFSCYTSFSFMLSSIKERTETAWIMQMFVSPVHELYFIFHYYNH